VTYLRGRIYVVCDECDRIIVYDAGTFARVNELVIKKGQVLRAGDIAACSFLNCLYVYDAHNACIWRVKDDGNHANKWMQLGSEVYTNVTLSVSLNGHVLLLGDEPPRLHIYSGQDAVLLHTILLPSDMKRPRHAVETVSGNFIISHGGWNSKRHRVCEVTIDGRVIRSYGDLEGGEVGRLNGPVHVAVDPVTRCVYIADLNNNRIVVLDPTLRLSRVLLSGCADMSCNPTRLCFVADTGRLLVLTGSGCLDIYSVGR